MNRQSPAADPLVDRGGARGVGLAEGSLRLATEYAQQRETMGKPIAQHQAIQLKLGEMVTRARAARLLTLDASEAYDLSYLPTP